MKKPNKTKTVYVFIVKKRTIMSKKTKKYKPDHIEESQNIKNLQK